MKHLAVSLHPDLVDPAALAGSAVAVVDVLRATTTIVHALAASAREVVVCGEVAETIEKARACWQCGTVLGGERGGVRIDGFDLGNSPTEYQTAQVAGRAVYFSTTNGTRALLKCRAARLVVTAALVNRQAVLQTLANESRVHIVCAGTRGQISRDDVLVAGAIVAGLVDHRRGEYELNDEAELARAAWNDVFMPLVNLPPEQITAGLAAALRQTKGGRDLIAIGMDADIVTAAQLDKFDLLPVLDAESMALRVR